MEAEAVTLPRKVDEVSASPPIFGWPSARVLCEPNVPDYFGPNFRRALAFAYLAKKRREVFQNRLSLMLSADGRQQSGKSVWQTTTGDMFDSTFFDAFDERVIHEPKEFSRAIESIARKKVMGGVVFSDETGVTFNRKDWYEPWMKETNKMMETLGTLHPILLFAAPLKEQMSSDLVRMFNGHYTVERTSAKFNYIYPTEAKHYSVWRGDPRGKFMLVKPKIRIFGTTVTLRRIKFANPPQAILERYRNFEGAAKAKLRERASGRVIDKEAAREAGAHSIEEIIKVVVENPDPYLVDGSVLSNPKMNRNKIFYGGFYLDDKKISRDDAAYVAEEAVKAILKNRVAAGLPVEAAKPAELPTEPERVPEARMRMTDGGVIVTEERQNGAGRKWAKIRPEGAPKF